MSMSSLSAQLASIHAANKNSLQVGSTLATSRRQDDAIGRGLHHSTQLGHGTAGASSALRKPSVIYPHSKTAADVPLTVLRENALSSLHQLSQLTQNPAFVNVSYTQTLCGIKSLQFERGLAMPKENQAVDTIIRDLLYLLSSAMAQEQPAPSSSTLNHDNNDTLITSTTTSCFSSCLHVLEYLVRRYDLHAYSLPLIEHWLVSLLPHHEHALFLRVLQLVDLASLPTWSFLRPYAATSAALRHSKNKNSQTTSMFTPQRSYLAQQVAQHVAMVHHVAQLAQRMAKLHVQETMAHHDGTTTASSSWPPSPPTRRGISHVLSFCAAIVVEALHWQSTRTGTLEETTIRALLPYLLTACGGGENKNKQQKKQQGDSSSKWSLCVLCPEYRGWGHVLASCIVELGVLSSVAQQGLLHTLVQGALELDKACCSSLSKSERRSSSHRIEAAADSVLVLLSVLIRTPQHQEDTAGDEGDNSHTTVLLKVTGPNHESSSSSNQPLLLHAMGFPPLSYNTIQSLCDWEAFVPAVAYLYNQLEIDVSNMVAAALVVALHRMTALHVKPKKAERALATILQMIQEDALAPLWTDSRTSMTASFAAAVVNAFATWQGDVEEKEEEENSNIMLKSMQSILDALRRVHPRGVDDGVAHAVLGTHHGKHKKARRKRIALLLGVQSTKQLPSLSNEDNDNNMETSPVDQTPSTGNLLPPRVALEHSDANIRLEAVQRALREVEDGAPNHAGTLEEALLRRVCVDDHVSVALAAGQALCGILQAKSSAMPFSELFLDMSLSALYRWNSYNGGNNNDGKTDIVCVTLLLVGYSIQCCSKSVLSDLPMSKVQCGMESIVAHLDDSLDTGIRKSALEALKLAVNANSVSTDGAKEILFSNAMAMNGLTILTRDSKCLNSYLGNGAKLLEIALRKTYVSVVVQMLLDSLRAKKDDQLAGMGLELCLLAIREADATQVKSKQVGLLRQCLEECVDIKSKANRKDVPSMLVSIASSGQDGIYEFACVKAIHVACKNVVDSGNNQVPKTVVIMEACLRPDIATLAIERLLSLAQFQASSHAAVLVPLLALLTHPEQRVRSLALKTCSLLSSSSDEGVMKELLVTIVKSKSSIVMDGASALPKLLADAVRKAENKAKVVQFLLKQCVQSASSSTGGDQSAAATWLPLDEAPGGNCAASIILTAVELAGEQAFPLVDRWKHAGEPVFNTLLGVRGVDETPVTLVHLMRIVVRMLKGVVVDEHSAASESSSIIIASGPDVAGTRSRSYSIGKTDEVTFVKAFPPSMVNAICACLTVSGDMTAIAKDLVRMVIEDVLGRESWGAGVFSKLELSLQHQIALSVLNLVDGEFGDVAALAFRCLPVHTRHLVSFLTQIKQSLSKASLISEVVQSRASSVLSSSQCPELISALFELLDSFSSESANFSEADGLEFARHSILHALLDIFELVASKPQSKAAATSEQLIDYARSLVGLLGGSGSSAKPLVSQRARSTAIAVLAITCSLLPPKSVLILLGSTMTTLITTAAVDDDVKSLRLAKEFLSAVVPVYCQQALAANLSLKHLFSEFVVTCRLLPRDTDKIDLLGCFVGAIHSIPAFEGESTPCGALLVVFLATELREDEGNENAKAGILDSVLAQYFPPVGQLSAVGELVHFTNGFLLSLSDRNLPIIASKRSPLSLSVQELELIAGMRNNSHNNETAFDSERTAKVLKLSCSVLSPVVEAFSSGALRKAIRASVGFGSMLCLRLWQDLLLLQSTLNCNLPNQVDNQARRKEWDKCVSLSDDALQLLQRLLPADVFLAAVSTLMMDDSTEELQARALRLVADRVSGVDPSSAEASLFLEQVPKFVEVMERARSHVVKQSALIATEKLGRTLLLKSEQRPVTATEFDYFFLALQRSSAILVEHSAPLIASNFVNEDLCQLVSSAALACATFVRVVTMRCLPVLPKLITSLLSTLSAANIITASNKSMTTESITVVSMLQVSMIRALNAICDVVPQFLGPYLKQLLSPSALPSGSLHVVRKDHDVGVKTEAELLERTVATKIPSRQLVPCVAHAIAQCNDICEVCILVSLLKRSIGLSSQADAISQRAGLLRSLTLAYEFESEERDRLLKDANELLLTFVLKLSEVQLLSLYAHLRDWRGELDKLNPEANATKRHAFWRLSGVLTKELKSLFLPCLSTASTDAIDELELGSKSLCVSGSSQKVHSGKKKRRLVNEDADSKTEYGIRSFRSLGPLLGCLEVALKADAREGGKWVRVDDGQRYNSLLEPLGRLLHCQLPPDFQSLAAPGQSVFHQLVLGTESEGGNVVDCLTALAAAAGNEQLWKPLNHLILEACGHETRSEVRKAGISCLLKVIRTIGDEYMVLLPECLPVLSEMLEDADEEIVSLAQQCVAVGEELLGESLQDSLR